MAAVADGTAFLFDSAVNIFLPEPRNRRFFADDKTHD
jgi:hypothetical protein